MEIEFGINNESEFILNKIKSVKSVLCADFLHCVKMVKIDIGEGHKNEKT